jgi:hypothetical protein
VATKGTAAREGFDAAMRRFPDRAADIRTLSDRSESFRDMCDELAMLEAALARVDFEPPERRESRRAEWEELMEQSLAEIERALTEVKVIPLNRKWWQR